MMVLLFGVLAFWIAGGFGRVLLRRVVVLAAAPTERFVLSTALGLGVVAYLVFVFGLIGGVLFSRIAIGVLWLLMAAVGWRGMLESFREVLGSAKGLFHELANGERVVVALCLLTLLFFGLVSLCACFLAPTGQAWDAVSYHLADPKLFLMQGHISVLPTEHHSNFPFTMEMLFTVGLLFGDFALANMFHWMMGLLCVIALVGYGRRRVGKTAGWLGAVLFVTTPVALWQASIAYIDIAVGLYTLLGSLFAVEVCLEAEVGRRRQFAILAGVMLGFALGIKYLALLPFNFILCLLFAQRVSVRTIALYAVVAGLIASPWYVKSAVLMGNPVYPYMYKIFPKSRYWSEDRGKVYDSEQQGFGYAHSLRQPVEASQNLLFTPWRLLGNAEKYSNQGEYTFMALFGGLWAGLLLAGALLRRVPRPVVLLTGLGLLQILAWFFLAQVSRYMVAVLPLLAVGGGYVLERLLLEGTGGRVMLFAQKLVVGGAIVGQVAVMGGSLFLLPVNGRTAMESGVLPTVVNIPDLVSSLGASGGVSPRLTKSLEYPAMAWINGNTDPKEGVVLFEETRGFYLDRPYLWGNGEHSSFIPYESFANGEAMSAWFRRQGIRYALVNLNWSSKKGDPEMPSAPIHLEREALRRWYVDTVEPVGWRGLLADAIRRDLWRVVYAERGIVILEIRI